VGVKTEAERIKDSIGSSVSSFWGKITGPKTTAPLSTTAKKSYSFWNTNKDDGVLDQLQTQAVEPRALTLDRKIEKAAQS